MWCLTWNLCICNVDCVNFNVFCVLSFRVTYLFYFCCHGVSAMSGGLKVINSDKTKYDTSMNIYKFPPSLEESWNPAAVRSVASDNSGSECNNEILTENDESDDGIIKPSSPSGMWGLMRILFIFGVEYIYWWCGLGLFFMSIMIIFDVNYYLCYRVWLFLTWIMMIFVVISVYVNAYFISLFFREWYPKEKTNILKSIKIEEA